LLRFYRGAFQLSMLYFRWQLAMEKMKTILRQPMR